MIIPQFWAESRRQHREGDRQITVHRFGWSDASQAEAQTHADQRATEALRRVAAGESLSRRERKQTYNGAEGAPIREEVIGRHGEAVVTRNSYGVRCLNVPHVFFADVDHTDAPSAWVFRTGCAVTMLGALAAGCAAHSILSGVLALLPAALLGGLAATRVHGLTVRWQGGVERIALRRVSAFAAARPAWGLRVYRTPAGLRLLATHRTFVPREPEIDAAFLALHADPVYARMCQRQGCFRARVSPKPWRIGINEPIRPRRVWPIPSEFLPARQAWVERYEARAQAFAACELLETLGCAPVDPAVQPIVDLHDDLCRAAARLPLA